MLKKEKNLTHKDVVGKKIRSYSLFPGMLFYCVPLIIFLFASIWNPVSGETAKVLIVMWSAFIGFFSLLFLLDHFCLGKILCVFSGEELFFFEAIVLELNQSKSTKKESFCGGSVAFDDIKYMEHVPAVRKWMLGQRRIVEREYVILKGTDFQIQILEGTKGLIKKIQKMQSSQADVISVVDLPDFDKLKHERHGIWKTIWDAFEDGAVVNLFDKDTTITEFSHKEEDNAITLIVEKNDCEITFNIDEDGLYMSSDYDDHGKDIPFSKIPDIKSFYTYLREYVDKNAEQGDTV